MAHFLSVCIMCPCEVYKRLSTQTTHDPEILHAGRVRKVVIYFRFHKNQLTSLGAVCVWGGSKIALSHW